MLVIGGLTGHVKRAGADNVDCSLTKCVALTFDDLPFADAVHEHSAEAKALTANAQIQSVLRQYSAPAIGFVNEAKVQSLGKAGLLILKSWNRVPFELGNHGFAHLDSNDLTLPQIDRAQRVNQAFEQVLDDPAAAEALQQPALKPLLELAAD